MLQTAVGLQWVLSGPRTDFRRRLRRDPDRQSGIGLDLKFTVDLPNKKPDYAVAERLIPKTWQSPLAAMLLIDGARAALAWAWAWPTSHAYAIPAIHWVNEPERPIDEALRDLPK